jgi:hypothetical protein
MIGQCLNAFIKSCWVVQTKTFRQAGELNSIKNIKDMS